MNLMAAKDVPASLPSMLRQAAHVLTNATTAAEILEAGFLADRCYDVAKAAAHLAKAEAAHDEVVAAAHKAQGYALEIKADASRKYYEETQRAMASGEIPARGGNRGNQHTGGKLEDSQFANSTRHHEINREGKIISAAESADPGIVHRAVDDAIRSGQEPTKAKLREAVLRVVRPDAAPSRPARGREAICIRVRDAIAALSGLPPASEVVGYFACTDSAIIVNEHLAQAATWLNDFHGAWEDASNVDQD